MISCGGFFIGDNMDKAGLKATLDELLKAVKEDRPSTQEIIITYSGSGDSGEVQDPELHFSGSSGVLEDSSLNNAFIDLAYGVLEDNHPGWEINEGSYGSLDIEVATGRVTLSHTYYIEHDEGAVILEGDYDADSPE